MVVKILILLKRYIKINDCFNKSKTLWIMIFYYIKNKIIVKNQLIIIKK